VVEDCSDSLALLTIDRPHARNAIELSTTGELEEALDAAAGTQALVIRGGA
jgi:enoyl-CoA hydratase/carnithine racemase